MLSDDLVRAASTATAELENHLRTLTPADRPWRFGSIAVAAHAQFIAPVENGLSLALIPAPTEVIVAVDLHLLTPDVLGSVLLHTVAHLALGQEKAELGLWRMIGEMLGESRRLHAAAERYQNAAYQRQAASRMIAMLEE